MPARTLFRSAAATALLAGLCLAVLPGCGSSPPTKAEKKGGEPAPPGPTPPGPAPGTPPDKNPNPGSIPIDSKSTLGPVEDAADKAATAFLRALGQGTAKAEMLSTNFLKVVGKPVDLPSDMAKGYSAGAATDWLKRIGEGLAFSPALDRKQAGTAVYVRGSLQGKPGSYSLRLVKEGDAWKVDALALSSAEWKGTPAGGTADAAFQEFAVTAFVEALADSAVVREPNDRAPLVAAAVTPELRQKWAPPFDQDKARGYDYSPAQLAIAATKIGGGTRTFTVARTGDLAFQVELTKPGDVKKAFTVTLVKGATPGAWLVSAVNEPKG